MDFSPCRALGCAVELLSIGFIQPQQRDIAHGTWLTAIASGQFEPPRIHDAFGDEILRKKSL